MDAIDREIIALLQQDGRMSLTDLAREVGLTLSPAHRRLQHLEEAGVIYGYRAMVDPEALDLGLEALVFVTMRQEDRDTITAFEEAVTRIPNIIQAQRLLGDPDYVLRIRAANIQDLTRITDETLFDLPGVHLMNSHPVAKNIVTDRPYPA
ncbi:MAG: Lrp/AsnC family transcriptional regulator [Yaniella sp.]|uniref:Lrp/AsnC family transcriptional regulator n=1 Tax=Yaniella sp. TaxID=2773929 RepID=UPI00264901C6|nr:Lrp/AsnC family transcriptional regulator [Yaniella sp.]MDN5731646.1 Lrp/AsnC family transcriptional regulator [Yaniella sp.]MDN5743150.1 Lrp/AsnC family transcriptional regulator [Yaniella sp.]MDN5817409.1 Lrp/AsnC family transcriptional regulator [Yaniella sp.]MDN5838613.1 Lrp/AsnC family transcriptional regulator [Yaniella sp.]MDN5889073.1 Lrp/AsnC family transcriptional regulator [Yaniella sp.]